MPHAGATLKMWGPSEQQATVAGKRTGTRAGKDTRPGKPGKPPGKPRKRWVTIVKWTAIAGLVATALMAATVALTFWMYGRDPKLPRIEKLADYHPKQVTTIVDKNDQRIGEIFTQRRTYVPYDKIPPILVDAFIAAEDNNYWEHEGVDYWGMVRAFFANLRAGKTTQGASTITQQVVKNFLLTPERTFKRKIQEIILARRLEKALTKQEIITLYLNEIYFGGRRYGVQEAARFYFGKDVTQINAGEAAVLASLPKEPETFYRALKREKNPQRVKDRQVYVLNQLVKIGKLSPAEAKKWIEEPIKIVKDPFPYLRTAPEWVGLVKNELKDRGIDTDTAGATVRTTLDPTLQQTAQKALQAGLRAVDERHKIGRAKRNIPADKIDLELAKLAKRLPRTGPKPKEIYDAIVTSVHDDDNEVVVDLGKWEASIALGTPEDARYNPPDDKGHSKKPSERFKRGDVVEVQLATAHKATDDDDDDDDDVKVKHAQHQVAFATGPQGAVVIMEVKTRKVRALVGGYTSKVAGFNRATDAHRQPGSSFKPFVYTTAIDSGKYTAATRVNDAPEVFDLWKPKNYETGKFEGPVLLRHALKKSINTVAIRVTYDLKPETVVEMAHKLGIVSELPKEMSLALGSGEVTPLELTNAIATIAAGGISMAPRFIDAIDGKATPQPQGSQALRPEVAYVITNMMQSVVNEGTAHRAAVLKIPIAGKTGTSNEARDTWFVGFTPDYIVCVWIGYDDNRPMGRKETGGTTAVPVFVDIMKDMKLPAKAFPKPAHVVEKLIDRETGLLAPEGAPKDTTLTEVFVEGTEPTEIAPRPGEVTEGSSVTGEYGD
ncbi:MAG TPA: PBP1A family penicillin-binding protein [Kofleriaceae bacterium]|nr:PBP1A family penicillin-binding protein [Kofleriaceae bacterium]